MSILQLFFTVAIGTLRYMGARLRGLDQGRKKDDPLRMELDKIRSKLVELKKLQAIKDSKPAKSDTPAAQNNDIADNRKRRKT